MRVAVAGGTGTVGRHVVDVLTHRGIETVVIARSRGVELVTGAGLDAALAGVDVVVDVSNVTTTRATTAIRFFESAGTTLSRASARAGVSRIVVLSIVGIDRAASLGYYAGKLRQEEVATAGPVPVTILRATQFHEFAEQLLARGRLGPVSVVPRMRIQPIAAATVAEHLARLAIDAPAGRVRDLAGPREESLASMSRLLIAAQGRHRRVSDVRMPGAAGAAMADGALLPGSDAALDGPDYESWLALEPR